MSLRLNGLNPLAYLGVTPSSPPQFVVYPRAPTINDYQNFNIGTEWEDSSTQNVYKLVSLSGTIASPAQNHAIWALLTSGAGDVTNFHTDNGDVAPAAGIVNVFGDNLGIITTGSGNTIGIEVSGLVVLGVNTDAGAAIGSGNALSIVGGSGITTSGSGSTVTITATGTSKSIWSVGTNLGLGSTSNIAYLAPFASIGSSSSSIAEFLVPLAGTLSDFYVNIVNNPSTVDVTFTLLVNGSPTSVTATATALTTGSFSDLVHTATISVGDLVTFEISQSATAVPSGMMSMVFTA